MAGEVRRPLLIAGVHGAARDAFTHDDPRRPTFFGHTKQWSPASPLRTDLAGRPAPVEIGVLAAQALGLAREEPLTIYRVQFPVRREARWEAAILRVEERCRVAWGEFERRVAEG